MVLVVQAGERGRTAGSIDRKSLRDDFVPQLRIPFRIEFHYCFDALFFWQALKVMPVIRKMAIILCFIFMLFIQFY